MGFACLYLPWGISPRTLNYGHYLFEAIPYACLSLGMLLDRYWDTWRDTTRGYVAQVVATFLFFFPFYTGYPVPAPWYYYNFFGTVVRPWTWFTTWV
jgi:dolichyl-phosphate-mannose--protein O-mannosyl transferase